MTESNDTTDNIQRIASALEAWPDPSALDDIAAALTAGNQHLESIAESLATLATCVSPGHYSPSGHGEEWDPSLRTSPGGPPE